MFILLNMSKKLEAFNLYTNCFYSLIKDSKLQIISFSKKMIDDNIDFIELKNEIESVLVKENVSKYNLIILYDFSMQQNNPLIYSITGILNNIKEYVINEISNRYVIDNIYFVTQDDVERDFDGQVIDKKIKTSIYFDKDGFISDDVTYDYFFKKSDLEFINNGLKDLINEYKLNNKLKENVKLFNDFNKLYLSKVENRIIKAIEKNIEKNNIWYQKKAKLVFDNYKEGIKDFLNDVAHENESIENIKFTIKSYIEKNITSYSDLNRNKIFRINMLDNEGRFCRGEAQFKNYYKVISFICYLIMEDKKYIFGNYISNQNHYVVNMNIDDNNINDMIIAYNMNLNKEIKRLGDVRFNEINVPDYEDQSIDIILTDDNKVVEPKHNFALYQKDENLEDVEKYKSYLEESYVNYVNFCNKRLRKLTDKFRIARNKVLTGKRKSIAFNELQGIIDEKKKAIKEIQDRIINNIPNDTIQVDNSIYETNKKFANEIKHLLKDRISLLHIIINIVIIFVCSLTILPMTRRFDMGLVGIFYKILLIMTPVLIYIFLQYYFCQKKLKEINVKFLEMRNFISLKLREIKRDDNEFKKYVNDIYELMNLTKYIDKLNEKANFASIDIENYKYHKENIEEALNVVSKLSKLLNISLNNNSSTYKKDITINLNETMHANSAYCPLLYVKDNTENYILINNQHKESIKTKLLNIVDYINLDYDEVYNENAY